MLNNFKSKRLTRMYKWLDDNPYCIYGDYRDEISDDMAQMIISGEFDSFYEEFFEWELNAQDYADLSELKKEFATEFDYFEFEDMPERIKEIFNECVWFDTSDLLKTCLRNWRGNVCARLVKNNGEYIEFPDYFYGNKEDNKRFENYLKRHCGIDARNSEATYSETWLTVLGKVDLEDILNARQAPKSLWIDKDCFTIGHEPYLGSGTCGEDQYKGKRRKMKAEFFIDGKRGYGVDEIFGLTGECWSNELEIQLT